ncbi:hypothetical protein Hdeb2414_s0752g00943271 [Helianthus debilis subsp. tardiflorus]
MMFMLILLEMMHRSVRLEIQLMQLQVGRMGRKAKLMLDILWVESLEAHV